MHLDPAASIIAVLGGLSSVAKAANTSTTTVQRWRLPKQKGGTGGFIPRRHHEALLAKSSELGICLKRVAFIDPLEASKVLK